MPLFDMRCTDCGHVEEVLISMATDNDCDTLECGECANKALKRVILKAADGIVKGYCYNNDEKGS